MFLLKILVFLHAFALRTTRGRLLGKFRSMDFGAGETIGTKSGKLRYIPLLLVPYEDGVILIASMGGSDNHPSWYWNIKACPKIRVFWKGQTLNLIAEQVTDEKKAELWPLICSFYASYDAYQKKTKRNIPVFNCQPNPGID